MKVVILLGLFQWIIPLSFAQQTLQDSLLYRFQKGNLHQKTLACERLMTNYWDRQQYDSAKYYFNKGIYFAKELHHEGLLAGLYVTWANSILSDDKNRMESYQYLAQAEQILRVVPNDTLRAFLLSTQGRYYYLEKNYSTSEKYYIDAIELDFSLNQSVGAINKLAYGLNLLYDDYTNSKFQEPFLRKCLEYYQKNGTSVQIGRVECMLGYMYFRRKKGELFSKYFLSGLEKIEKYGEWGFKVSILLEAGNLFGQIGNYTLAKQYYYKTLEKLKYEYSKLLFEKHGYARQRAKDITQVYINIANIFERENQLDSASYAAMNAVLYINRTDDITAKVYAHNFAGHYLVQNGKYAQALPYLRVAQHLIADSEPSKRAGFQLRCYGAMGKAFTELAQRDSAIKYMTMAESIFKESQKTLSLLRKKHYYDAQAAYQEKIKNDYRQALRYTQLLCQTKDSIFDEERTNYVNDAIMRYDVARKEQEIINLSKENQIKELKNINQKYLLFGAGAFLLAVLGLSGLIIRQNRNKHKTLQLLGQQNQEIHSQNNEIEQTNQELNRTLVQLNKQNEDIILKNRKIEDSIYYAQRIQLSVLPTRREFRLAFQESFIYYSPRDIVSGDFYWLAYQSGRIIFAVVDCTGHGVPGAFMSVVGAQLLHEIVVESKKIEPDRILSELDRRIRNTLRQDHADSDSNDGMDIAVIAWNPESRNLWYAGAGRPLYGMVKDTFLEIKPDKYPIGGVQFSNKFFTAHQLQLDTKDCIYLFTDGITDQFGGPQKRKLTPVRLQKWIIEHYHLHMAEQGRIFEDMFKEWKKESFALDDATMIGLRL